MLSTGTLIEQRFRIERSLGRGGMGAVYLAEDVAMDEQEVALKLLHLGDDMLRRRFRREARLMARFEHPGVVSVLGTGEHEGDPFIVMPYLAEGTLARRYAGGSESYEDLAERLLRMVEVADALTYVHGQGVVHRDLKPDNVMIHGDRAVLMDFGLAKGDAGGETMQFTQHGAILGTAAYMSPEQVRGANVDARSDLYALGCLMFWTLVGEAPFQGAGFTDVLLKQINEPVRPPSNERGHIPPEVDAIVLKLMRKPPSERYSAAADVVADLRTVLAQLGDDSIQIAEAELADDTPQQLLEPPLIGRDEQFRTLRNALGELPGTGRVFLVEAPPGTGMTRLLGDLVDEATFVGARTLRLTHPRGPAAPYHGWREALAKLLRRHPTDVYDAAEGLEEGLGPLLPDLAPSQGTGDVPAEVMQLRMYDAVDRLLSRLAADRQVVIVADDLQRADDGSIGLFSYLARGQLAQTALLIGAVHPGGRDATLADVPLERMELEPLGDDAMRALVRGFLGGEVATPLERHVLRRAAGRPFFLEEMLLALLRAGHLRRHRGVWSWSGEEVATPPGIEAVFEQRLSSISDDARKVAGAASTIGVFADYDLLTDIVSLDEDDLLDALDELIRAGIFQETKKGYAFTPSLLRDLLHEQLSERRRIRYHAKLAERLEQDPNADPGVLADHFAEAGDLQRTVAYAWRAAAEAERVYANDVAEHYYRVALRFLEGEAERFEVMIDFGGLLDRMGRWGEAREWLDRAAANASTRADALRRLGLVAQREGNLVEAEENLRASLRLAPGEAETYRILGRTLIAKGEFDTAEQAFEQALSLAPESGEARTEVAVARAQIDLGELTLYRGEFDRTLEWLDTAQRALEPFSEVPLKARALNLRGHVHLKRGQLDKALACFTGARDSYERAGDLERAISALTNVAITYGSKGDFQRAVELLTEARDRSQRIGDEKHMALASANIGEVLFLYLGKYDEAIEALSEAEKLFRDTGDVRYRLQVVMNLATAYSWTGDHAAAEAQLADARQGLDTLDSKFFEGLWWLRAAEVAFRSGRVEEGAEKLASVIDELTGKEGLESRILELEIALARGEQPDAERVEEARKIARDLEDRTSELKIGYLYARARGAEDEARRLADDLIEAGAKHFLDLVESG